MNQVDGNGGDIKNFKGKNPYLVDETPQEIVAPGALTKVASISVGNADTLWLVRHYTGIGAIIKYLYVYVIRKQQLLGRFDNQEQVSFEVEWYPNNEHSSPASESELLALKKARVQILSMVDKVWV